MNEKIVNKILAETERGYDSIADKFSATRKYVWRDLEFLKKYVGDGDRLLDYGCGNGRLTELFSEKNVEYYGVDVSEKLIGIAEEKYGGKGAHFRKISGSDSLPFSDDFFNGAVSVAVFHHLPGKDLRRRCAKELFRVTKPGGYVLVTVWNLWQKKYRQYVWQNIWKKLAGKSELDFFDAEVSFKDDTGKILFERYHHAFTPRELRKLFENAGFETVECDIMNKRNVIFIGKKI